MSKAHKEKLSAAEAIEVLQRVLRTCGEGKGERIVVRVPTALKEDVERRAATFGQTLSIYMVISESLYHARRLDKRIKTKKGTAKTSLDLKAELEKVADPCDARLQVYVAPTVKAEIQRRAEAEGLSLSAYLVRAEAMTSYYHLHEGLYESD